VAFSRRLPARWTSALAVGALLVAVAVAGATARPPVATAAPTALPTWHAQYVSIPSTGARMWIECAGAGPETVVVIPGLNAPHTMWNPVLEAFAETTRTCIADRPGDGSSPRRQPHRVVSALTHAEELWDVLKAAGEHGPYVVVGHSYGGLVARAFVARFFGYVSGLMLVEGVAPYDQTSTYWPEGGDLINMRVSSAAASLLRMGSMPLVVESAADPARDYWGGPSYGDSAAELADWRAHQAAAARLSTNAAWVIVAYSAHVIEHDRPGAVIAGLQLLVHAALTHTVLPTCSLRVWGPQPNCRL
jgi:pimeloyl-ACP methyl ester carboxylesterase